MNASPYRSPWTIDPERWMRDPRRGLVPGLRRRRLALLRVAGAVGLRDLRGIYAWSRPGVLPRARHALRARQMLGVRRGDLLHAAPGSFVGTEPDLARVVAWLLDRGWTLKAVAERTRGALPAHRLTQIRRGHTGASLPVALLLLRVWENVRREPPPPRARLGRPPFPVLPARGMGPSPYRGFLPGPEG